MSREIKFRAWDKRNERWLEGSPFDKDLRMTMSGGLTLLSKTATEHKLDVFEIELVQFTGLKDKNGKEIYEGDIVSCVGGYEAGESEAPEIVSWNDETLQWDAKGVCPLHEFDLNEVIGNIYENPDLLTSTNEKR